MERTIGYRYCFERLMIDWMSNDWQNISGDRCNKPDNKNILELHDLALRSYNANNEP